MTILDSVTQVVSIVNEDVGHLPTSYPDLTSPILQLFNLNGKAAVITGGVRGIGLAISEGYCQAQLSKLAIIDYSDVTTSIENLRFKNAEQVKNVIHSILERFSVVDIFVANAGIAWTSGALCDQPTYEEWHNVFDVDVNGVYHCTKNIGRLFKSQGKGSLIITASMSAHIVNVPNYQVPYNAAKASVLHLSRSLAVECAGFARVNTISPGYMDSGLSDFVSIEQMNIWYKLTPKGRQGHPKELVGAYLYLASDAATFTTGSDIRVDGGYCSV